MTSENWLRSNVRYGRKLVSSGIEGASAGRAQFLAGRSVGLFLAQAVRDAVPAAAAGIVAGALGGYLARRSRSWNRALFYSLAGGVIGFGAGFTWKTRSLAAEATRGALRSMDNVRDEHWLERNPIDYA